MSSSSMSVSMFRNTYYSGLFSILYSLGTRPLQIWGKYVRNGHIKRISDDVVQSLVLELFGRDVKTIYIMCPANPHVHLGIKMPYLVLVVKNLKKPFSFEVQVLDGRNIRRRFRANNFQRKARVKPYICTLPLRLDEGWNLVQINLPSLVRRVYSTTYIESLKVQIHGNCRLRRVYFTDRVSVEDQLPTEFKLYKPSYLCFKKPAPIP